MKSLLILVAALFLSTPVLSQEADTVEVVVAGPQLYLGVEAGTAFEDFSQAEASELVLSGLVAYETEENLWFEYDETMIGDEGSVGTVRVGYVPYTGGTKFVVGGEWVDQEFGVWGGALFGVQEDRFVRLSVEYAGAEADPSTGGVALKVGYFLAQ